MTDPTLADWIKFANRAHPYKDTTPAPAPPPSLVKALREGDARINPEAAAVRLSTFAVYGLDSGTLTPADIEHWLLAVSAARKYWLTLEKRGSAADWVTEQPDEALPKLKRALRKAKARARNPNAPD